MILTQRAVLESHVTVLGNSALQNCAAILDCRLTHGISWVSLNDYLLEKDNLKTSSKIHCIWHLLLAE